MLSRTTSSGLTVTRADERVPRPTSSNRSAKLLLPSCMKSCRTVVRGGVKCDASGVTAAELRLR